MSGKTQDSRVQKKRSAAACVRCRKQKIRCSGSAPCVQCSRRSHQCDFDNRQSKILVSQSYLLDLERRASLPPGQIASAGVGLQQQVDSVSIHRRNDSHHSAVDDSHQPAVIGGSTLLQHQPEIAAIESSFDADQQLQQSAAINCENIIHEESQRQANQADQTTRDGTEVTSPHDDDGERVTPDPHLTNPLDPTASEPFVMKNNLSRRFFLGVSSSWSFGKRVLSIVHERVYHAPPSADIDLLFEGSSYDLGWHGQRDASIVDTKAVPDADFALFLINAMKFHCGQLFHLFDEPSLMLNFARFYQNRDLVAEQSRLWYVHFLLILSLGKACMLQTSKTKKWPPGSELFVQAIKLLPNITSALEDPLHSMETFCTIALYYQCLDMRSAAYNVVGQAMRLALDQGLHTDMQSQHFSRAVVERCRAIWWTIYVLDRQMTATSGVPLSVSDEDISAPLPLFEGSSRRARALILQVQLAKANAVILQTVYRRASGQNERFLSSMRDALRTIGRASDERNDWFPLDLKKTSGSMCRLSAYLHILHHQALMLASRPLLYSFLQKRLEASKSLRISASRGARSLIRVCVSSAQQCLSILEALHSQSLLECFLPFDREAAFSSALVFIIAHAVDKSLVRDRHLVDVAYEVLEEMTARGNLTADLQKRELQHVDLMLTMLEDMAHDSTAADSHGHNVSPSIAIADGRPASSHATTNDEFANVLGEWNSEDELSGERLLMMADTLDLDSLHWFMTETFE